MNATVVVFCPQCLAPEVTIKQSPVIGGVDTVRCELCGFVGDIPDVMAIVSGRDETYWTSERIGNALLYGATRHAAGPMVQLLELVGLVPRIEGPAEQQKSACAVREGVVKAVLEAVVTSAFETAAALTPAHYQRFENLMPESAERIFRYAEPADDRSGS